MASNGNILAIDIGGSHLKGNILNSKGEEQTSYSKLDTPAPATPDRLIGTIEQLVKNMPDYEKVSVGFPGYIRNGVVFTAPNLDSSLWKQVDLGQQISNTLHKPVRLVNDADQLGLGVVSGKGLEIVLTLGTGLGTAMLIDGYLLPHMELAHHPIHKGEDYDAYIGDKARKKEGKKEWNKRVARALEVFRVVFNYDRLYLGGGNAADLTGKLDDNIHRFTNEDGIKGGARLWELPEGHHLTTNYPK